MFILILRLNTDAIVLGVQHFLLNNLIKKLSGQERTTIGE